MQKKKYPIYILNVSGGHGHFLKFVLDYLCVDTPNISTLPFNNLGNSHKKYKSSNYFEFIDHPRVKNFVKESVNKNLILITIEEEILYWERCCFNRSADENVNLFDQLEMENFLYKHGSDFPKYCKEKNLSLQQGYYHNFLNINKSGARILDNERKKYTGITNNNVYFYEIKNFMSLENFSKSIIDLSSFFKFSIDNSKIKNIYQEFVKRNKILQTQDNVEKYLSGDHTVSLDILQKAYVDSKQKLC